MTAKLQRRHCISWDAWNQESATEIVPTFRAAMKGTELNDATALDAVFCPSIPPPRFPAILGPDVITRIPKRKKRRRYRRGEMPPTETNPTST